MSHQNISFQDLKDPLPHLQTNPDPQEALHTYLIEQSPHEDPSNKEDPLIIIQEFIQNPYNPVIKDKMNFSPQKELEKQFPDLNRMNLKNQYNFYKSLVKNEGKQGPRWENLYEMVRNIYTKGIFLILFI